ncbi:MAG TPA: DUF1992 domain-containing protein [Chloroflexi bacterium]|nr:DUF1992 domain-containing protein [Chloroflexota bacterium]
MSIFERIAEDKIRRAQQEGKFDALPGAGKPLLIEENPYEPEGAGPAYRLLKNNGFTLPWIEEGLEIERELEEARRQLRQAGAGEDARRAFEERIAGLNRRILGYNLRVPAPVFQRQLLDAPDEIRKALQGVTRSTSTAE